MDRIDRRRNTGGRLAAPVTRARTPRLASSDSGSRADQLSGFSTLLILTMLALGGSMFPRFLMSETMQKMGLITFNAWALDGSESVLAQRRALWDLWPQVLVLSALAATFLSLARLLARRWELA